jgi:hypothetical protein
MIAESTAPLDQREDSNDYPQGPYGDGGGESDCPQHCGACGKFLQNPLTDDGYAYATEQLSAGGNRAVLQQWAKFYEGYNDNLDAAIAEFEKESGL